MAKPHIDYHELLESLGKPGCPACGQGARSGQRFLDSLLTDMVMNNLQAQAMLASSLGLCGGHAGRAAEMGRALPAAIVWDLVAGALLRSLDARPPFFGRQTPVSPSGPCPACEAEQAMADVTLLSLADHWHDERIQAAYSGSEGLCRPHLNRAWAVLRGRRVLAEIVAAEREKYRALQAALREFIQKQDYRHANEAPGREADAHLRAARKFGGRAPGE